MAAGRSVAASGAVVYEIVEEGARELHEKVGMGQDSLDALDRVWVELNMTVSGEHGRTFSSEEGGAAPRTPPFGHQVVLACIMAVRRVGHLAAAAIDRILDLDMDMSKLLGDKLGLPGRTDPESELVSRAFDAGWKLAGMLAPLLVVEEVSLQPKASADDVCS